MTFGHKTPVFFQSIAFIDSYDRRGVPHVENKQHDILLLERKALNIRVLYHRKYLQGTLRRRALGRLENRGKRQRTF